MEDYMLELDDGGLLRVIKEIRAINYDSQEVAVYKNWDYYKIEDDNDF